MYFRIIWANFADMQKTIFLTGYMGCGKTTLGQALAERADVRFVDLDDYIESKAGMPISEIFKVSGEAEFRRMEREALEEVSDAAGLPTVIACGGGTACVDGNMEYMNSLGLTVFLDTTIDRLVSRLSIARSQRPLIADLGEDELRDYVAKNLSRRLPHYKKSQASFDSTWLEDEEQVESTARKFIERFLKP